MIISQYAAPTAEPVSPSKLKLHQADRQSGIYQILCKPTGKVYIGSAVHLYHREKQHFSDLSKNKHGNPRLQRAWNKYGKDAFDFSVIEFCRKECLISREQYYLDELWKSDRENRFNIASIAGSNLGLSLSQETKERISKAKKGKSPSPSPEQIEIFRKNMIGNKFGLGYRHNKESLLKISESSKRRIFSKECKEKISKAMKGNQHCLGHICSEDTKNKISKANKGNIGRMGQPHNDHTKAKLSQAHTGKKHTDEHTDKMAIACARFTASQVNEIREILMTGQVSRKSLAQKYGCAVSTIGKIMNHAGRAYR